MNASDEAAQAARKIHDFAFTTLRTQFPFLKGEALDSIVQDLAQRAQDHVATQGPAMAETKASFSFFSLPPELRDQIYQYVMAPTENAILLCKTETVKRRRDRQFVFKWPALLSANKQIRQEGLPIFLGKNTFLALIDCYPFHRGDYTFSSWLEMVGSQRANMLKKLVLRYGPYASDDPEDPLQEFYGYVSSVYQRQIVTRRIARTPELDRYFARGGPREALPNKQALIKAQALGESGIPYDAIQLQCDSCFEYPVEILDDGSSRVINRG